VHKTLRHEQVGCRVGLDHGNTRVIAVHRDLVVEPGYGKLSAELGKGTLHRERDNSTGDEHQDDENTDNTEENRKPF
jgi:hypothetical protein